MAGKTVLIKSVVSALPYYQMQTVLMPKGVLKEIEKLSRDFFWNHNTGTKKLHLIGWESLKADKEHGGLGIRDLQTQNKAFLMKLCWGMLTRPDALWVQCLTNKYECGGGKYPNVVRKRNQSAVWQGITEVWDDFFKNVGRKIGNGQTTRAWTELWTPLDLPLIQYVERNVEMINSEDTVDEFVTPSGSWDWNKWRTFLPNWVIERIKGVTPPNSSGTDRHLWRASSDGNFNVSSAYWVMYNQSNTRTNQMWRQIWHWEIPERAKFFMWQVSHERIPTNQLRAKFNPHTSNECPFECSCEESIIHSLRDCEVAKNVWLSVINPIYMYRFFNGNLQEWLQWNGKHNSGSRRLNKWPWSRIFSILCWLIWKSRCMMVFKGTKESSEVIVR